jgi:alpha-1,3-rhamnosyl/mannosyltransferase
LFVGTLEPRKNIGGLLDAYEELIGRIGTGGGRVPELVLAGQSTPQSRPWLERIDRAPLKGIVRRVGYVHPSAMRELYAGARVLVLPSFDEGFGMPVLEAMTVGVPVVAARRGSLPEVLGDAGVLIDPEHPAEIADAIERVLENDAYAAECAARGIARARTYRWETTAAAVYDAYRQAIEHHAHRD